MGLAGHSTARTRNLSEKVVRTNPEQSDWLLHLLSCGTYAIIVTILQKSVFPSTQFICLVQCNKSDLIEIIIIGFTWMPNSTFLLISNTYTCC